MSFRTTRVPAAELVKELRRIKAHSPENVKVLTWRVGLSPGSQGSTQNKKGRKREQKIIRQGHEPVNK